MEGYHAGSLLLRTAQVAVTAMKEFQVRPPHPLDSARASAFGPQLSVCDEPGLLHSCHAPSGAAVASGAGFVSQGLRPWESAFFAANRLRRRLAPDFDPNINRSLDLDADPNSPRRRLVQEAQRAALGRDLGVDLLCALVNNNSRCYDESLDFADHMEQILPVGQGVRKPKAICAPHTSPLSPTGT